VAGTIKEKEVRGEEECSMNSRAVWVHLSVDLSSLK